MGLTADVGGGWDRIILRQTLRNGFTLVVTFRLHFRALYMLIKNYIGVYVCDPWGIRLFTGALLFDDLWSPG